MAVRWRTLTEGRVLRVRLPPVAPFDGLRAGSFDGLRAGSFDGLRAGSFDGLRAGSFDGLRAGPFVWGAMAAAPCHTRRRSAHFLVFLLRIPPTFLIVQAFPINPLKK